ncbi:SDR family NAD(P)-dependent oxidoreductase [Aromatoleum petrolei]|uniref:SDR family NAD(P)-dependent oxidoreductase n=1 Tax=Aromatoleum petrolei TaxID=76116 RepID=A0ABX1MVJ8_9RHOO|nr:SDR family NAD(P)-dependent oxidoreductase [Aromatoleum petrolei]NMF90613.1 SDR family NAD(P)-dependent oxidoreductase [Aromatoleum petrolei]
MKKIVIVGATSAMAEHCARLWVQESPKVLVLAGRDQTKTERVAQDLRVRSPQSEITVQVLNFLDPDCIHEWVEGVTADGVPDIVLIAHGSLPDQMDCQQELGLCEEVLTVNGVSPALFAEAFANPMQRANRGTLAIIGSVAGDRGRKSNYVYGAAKGLVTRYAQGLQHRLARTNVKVVLIKPGPTDTPMTERLKADGVNFAEVSDVAKTIVVGVARGTPLIYTPRKWILIMMIVRHLPRFIFNRMDI